MFWQLALEQAEELERQTKESEDAKAKLAEEKEVCQEMFYYVIILEDIKFDCKEHKRCVRKCFTML